MTNIKYVIIKKITIGDQVKQKIISLMVCVCALVLLTQFSSQQSTQGREKPKLNIYGSIKDQNENNYDVQYITISGLYEQIPFYAVPKKMTIRPDTNITYLDLNEIDSIKVITENDNPKIKKFNGREYIEIEITLRDPQHTKTNYVIEKSRKIFSDAISNVGQIDKEMSFEALDTLTIKGIKERSAPAGNS